MQSEQRDEYGHRVVALDDYDGDGLPEVAVSGDGGGESPPGVDVYILPGSTLRDVLRNSATSPSVGVENLPRLIIDDLDGPSDNNGLGFDMALLPDLDGDSLDEVLICAPDARQSNNLLGSSPFAGSSIVVFGNAIEAALGSTATIDIDSLIANNNAVRLDGANMFDSDCTAVSSAGDFDGDGVSDVLIGEGRAGIASQSRAHVVYGRAILQARQGDGAIRLENLETDELGVSIITELTLDLFGGAVSNIGDFNADGFDDAVIGAPRTGDSSGQSSRGAAYVFFGTEAEFTQSVTRQDLVEMELGISIQGGGSEATDQTGSAFAAAGDINGDGFDDFFVSTPGADTERNGTRSFNDGRVDLILGTDTELVKGTEFELRDYSDGVRIFGAFSTQGIADLDASRDLDGDGVRDLLIGATRSTTCLLDGSRASNGQLIVVSGARILDALGKNESIDLNDHLFGGNLTANVPGTSSLDVCSLP